MIKQLQTAFPESVEIRDDGEYTSIYCPPEALRSVMDGLKKQGGCNYLGNLTAVDYPDAVEMVYHLYSIPVAGKFCVKSRLSKDQPEVDSIADIYPSADWQEREVFDLMGVNFRNHPNLIRILLPDDFEGHPLRKDYGKGVSK